MSIENPNPSAEELGLDREVTPETESLSYETFFARERPELLEGDPFETYEKLRGRYPIEGVFKHKVSKLVGPGKPKAIKALWHPKKGTVYVKEGTLDMGKRGYVQAKAGFKRYEVEFYKEYLGARDFLKFRPDSMQEYEVGLATHMDALSEPVPTENPDYDPEIGSVVEGIAQRWLRGGSLGTMGGHRENGDWFVADNNNCGVVVPEFGLDKTWIGLRVSDRGDGGIEGLARRIGHNCRVYRAGAESYQQAAHLYARTDYNRRWRDGRMILVPVGIEFPS